MEWVGCEETPIASSSGNFRRDARNSATDSSGAALVVVPVLGRVRQTDSEVRVGEARERFFEFVRDHLELHLRGGGNLQHIFFQHAALPVAAACVGEIAVRGVDVEADFGRGPMESLLASVEQIEETLKNIDRDLREHPSCALNILNVAFLVLFTRCYMFSYFLGSSSACLS